MIDCLLVEDLANAAPQVWAEMIARASVIERFLRTGQTTIDADSAAAALGIQRRQFYKLRAAHQKRRAGGAPIRSLQGFGYWIPLTQERIISEALANAGPGARLCDVFAEAANLSEERGADPPSMRSVRTRFGKSGAQLSLGTRLRVNSDRLYDLCGLDLNLVDPDGRQAGACILIEIAIGSGQVLNHQLFTGVPIHSELAPLIASSDISEKGGLDTDPTSTTRGLSLALVAQKHRGRADPSPEIKLSPGAAAKAAFGDRIGRIRLRCDPKTWGTTPEFPAIPRQVAGMVVRHLINVRNQSLKIVSS